MRPAAVEVVDEDHRAGAVGGGAAGLALQRAPQAAQLAVHPAALLGVLLGELLEPVERDRAAGDPLEQGGGAAGAGGGERGLGGLVGDDVDERIGVAAEARLVSAEPVPAHRTGRGILCPRMLLLRPGRFTMGETGVPSRSIEHINRVRWRGEFGESFVLAGWVHGRRCRTQGKVT
ncbi:hypothetical protein GCM10023334_119420 [Nonomuraea thailandensis]